MSYFPGIFITQYHKSRAGYYINHDMLMSASPEARNKLIFYYIAENVPQKLKVEDELEYRKERNSRIGNPITFWTYAAFLGVFGPTAFTVLKKRRSTAIRDIFIWTALAGYFATIINSTLWRTTEARMIESSEVLERLANKYQFGVFDFALAKKETHVQKLMDVYDVHRTNVHDS